MIPAIEWLLVRHFSVITEELSTGLNQWTSLFNVPPTLVVRLKWSFPVNLSLNSDWLIGMLLQDQHGCWSRNMLHRIGLIKTDSLVWEDMRFFWSKHFLLASRGHYLLPHYVNQWFSTRGPGPTMGPQQTANRVIQWLKMIYVLIYFHNLFLLLDFKIIRY